MTIRIGIIGAGKIVRVRHLPEAEQNPNAEVRAVCDLIEDRAQELADQYHCKPYTDYKKMIQDPELDAIVVAATNKTHAMMTIDALNAGKHVLCEKPMATSLEDAKQMLAAAEKNGKQLMIGNNQRLETAHQKAKDLLQSGKLGKVLTFNTVFGHPGSEEWAIEGDKTWFYKKEVAGLGVLGDLAIHKLDLVRWLINEDYAQVSAFTNTLSKTYADGTPIDLEDNAVCVLKTRNGILGTLSASWSYKKEKNVTTIYCQKGVMEIFTDPEFPLAIHYNHEAGEYYQLGKKSTNLEQLNSGVMDAFVGALNAGKDVPIPGIEGYKALEAVMACQRSAESGQVVTL
ncbi:MAG: Gfo/Idh/MocA family oxidoreductase [Chloroflexota bacterium]|nr:Gfo/Idh/MocA family oxidoreductase [Chloroflexota bacterium]